MKPNRDDPPRNVHWEIVCVDYTQDRYEIWAPCTKFDKETFLDPDVEGERSNTKIRSGTFDQCLDLLRAIHHFGDDIEGEE